LKRLGSFSRSQHLIALILVLVLFGVWWVFHRPRSSGFHGNNGKKLIFVEVAGQVKHPGVYWFERAPSLMEALTEAGGITTKEPIEEISGQNPVASGTLILVSSVGEGRTRITTAFMAAEKRIALRIPLDVNRATLEELALLPYVTPGQAAEIVRLRKSIKRFTELKELSAVQGIGPQTLKKLEPFLVIRP